MDPREWGKPKEQEREQLFSEESQLWQQRPFPAWTKSGFTLDGTSENPVTIYFLLYRDHKGMSDVTNESAV